VSLSPYHCKDCFYFRRRLSQAEGECHRYPPTVHLIAPPQYDRFAVEPYNVLPIVSIYSYCGEFLDDTLTKSTK